MKTVIATIAGILVCASSAGARLTCDPDEVPPGYVMPCPEDSKWASVRCGNTVSCCLITSMVAACKTTGVVGSGAGTGHTGTATSPLVIADGDDDAGCAAAPGPADALSALALLALWPRRRR
jgi:hypothetical protein